MKLSLGDVIGVTVFGSNATNGSTAKLRSLEELGEERVR